MKKTLITLLLLAQAACAAEALATQLFDFDAQALMPAGVGGTATVFGRIVNGSAVTPPLPLDFAGHEYTIAVTGLVQLTDGTVSQFAGGAVAIYEDAATTANYADPSTFTDGTAILTGSLGSFQRTMFTGTLGSGVGSVDWTGGTLLDLLAPADRLGWPFLTAISRATLQVQPGYSERWDGKVEPQQDVVPTAAQSWSGVKAGYR